jgi:Tol biopolymer transport system component
MSKRHLFLFLSLLIIFSALELCSNNAALSQTDWIGADPVVQNAPTRDWVVYSKTDPKGTPWLWAMPEKGTQPVRLFEGYLPVKNPVGDQVAFVRDTSDEGATVFRAAILEKSPVALYVSKEKVSYLAWSPRGNQLAVGLLDKIVLVRTDGSPENTLNLFRNGIGFAFNPVWMPGGDALMFHDNRQVYVMSTKGVIVERLPIGGFTGGLRETDAATDSSDRFIPHPTDPNVWAFTAKVPGTPEFDRNFNGEPNTALFLYDRNTGVRRRLTPDHILAMDPVWSRDGGTLWFTGYADRDGTKADPWKIYRVNADGTGLTLVAVGEHPTL